MHWSTVNHGIPGLAFAYALTGIPMVAGLIKARARWQRFLTAPLVAIPVTAVALLGWQVVRWLRSFQGPIPRTNLVYWFAAIFLIAFGFLAGVYMGGRGADAGHKRGALIEAARRKRVPAGQVSLAGIAIPPLDETKHFKQIGTTGTGKSTAIRELLQGALARGDRLIVADPDAGYLNRFYDAAAGDIILNPFDARAALGSIRGDRPTLRCRTVGLRVDFGQ